MKNYNIRFATPEDEALFQDIKRAAFQDQRSFNREVLVLLRDGLTARDTPFATKEQMDS